MEGEWIADRVRLRCLMQAHPDWSIRELYRRIAEEVGRCFEWVRKWYHRLKQADPDDDRVLFSRSRRRKTPYAVVSEVVEAKIIHLRDTLSKEYHRRVGARNILYHLHQDEWLKWKQEYLPRSTSTINRILHKYQRIPRRAPRIRMPRQPAEPMAVFELDFTDVITARSDTTDKKAHQVESLHVIDTGTSIALETKIRDDFNAETVITVMAEVFWGTGLPKVVRFDRDTRLVGSWSMDKFPSAFMRFLLCLGVQPEVCPPRRPDLKPYVERFIRSFQEECVYPRRPHDVAQAQVAALDYHQFYNLERPNQAVTCGNQPPSLVWSDLPRLPRLPKAVDPDAWLDHYDGKGFKRLVRSNGSVTVDKYDYYIGKRHRGRRIWLRLNAETKQFEAFLDGAIIKQVNIKGLYHGEMEFGDYLELIAEEARSEERRLQMKRRKQHRIAA